MARYTKTGTLHTIGQIDSNLDLIATAIGDTLSRKGDSPNQMESSLDMNSQRILNLPTPLTAVEPLRLGDVPSLSEFQSLLASTQSAKNTAVTAEATATSASNSATVSAATATFAKIGAIEAKDLAVAASIIQYQTFAELLAISETVDYKQFTVAERANAAYTLQPAGYVALAGDATLTNGRVAQLQKSSAGWHIENFGAKEGTNSTTYIKNAIVRAADSVIVGNPVDYWIDEELLFSEDRSGLAGIGGILTLFNLSLTETSIRFSPATPELGGVIYNNTLSNVRLGRSVGSSGAIALKLHQVSQLSVSSFRTLASHTAIEIKGIKNSAFDNLQLFAGNGISPLAGSALITYDGYPLTAGGYTEAWTTNINNIIASCDFNTAYVFDLRKTDGLQITTGYVASPSVAHVNIEPLDSGSGVGTVIFNSVYFDGINKDTGSISGLRIPTHIGTYVNDIKFIGSKFGGFQSNVINIIGVGTNIEFNGTTLRASNGKGIRAASNAQTSIKMIGGNIGYCDEGVNIENIKTFIMNGTLIDNSVKGVTLTNTSTAALNNISFENVTTELDITNVPVLTGGDCVSDVNGIVDINAGTFAPTLRINFSTTGITYAEQIGNYVKNGNVVTFTIKIVLLSKGSNTGIVTIQNLPFSIKSLTSFSLAANKLASGVGLGYIQAESSGLSSSAANLWVIDSSGDRVGFTNADIEDDTEVLISGSYIAD